MQLSSYALFRSARARMVRSGGLCLLALASMMPHGAQAQKGLMFAPETQWSVSQVSTDMAGGQAYCAMARRFDKNAILTIARNQQQESSIAIDMQSPQFRINGSFNVVLDPGAGEQREFTIKPVSNAAFVVRLGDDEKFFKALERTGLLRIETQDEIYHFNLADIDKGQFKLGNCLSVLRGSSSDRMPVAAAVPVTPVQAAPVRMADATPAAPSMPSSQAAEFQSDLQQLRGDLQNLQQENQRLASQVQQNSGTPTRARAPVPVASADAPPSVPVPGSMSAMEIARLRDQIASLQKENAGLQEAMVQQSDMPDLAQELLDTKATVQKLTIDVAERDRRIVELSRTLVDYEQVKQDNTKLRQQVASLEGVQEKLAALEVERDTLRAQVSAKGSEVAKVDDTLRGQMIALRTENQNLKQRLASLEANSSVRVASAEQQMPVEKPAPAAQAENEPAVPVAPVQARPVATPVVQNTEPRHEIATGDGRSLYMAQRYEEAVRANLGAPRGQAPAMVASSSEPPAAPVAPVMAEAVPPAEPVTAAPAAVARTQSTTAAPYNTASADSASVPFVFEDLLEKASVVKEQDIKSVSSNVVQRGRQAYQWRSNNIFGTAEQGQVSGDAGFETAIQDYLQRTQSRCHGDFAIVPERSVDTKSGRLDSYEIACVGKDVNSSAALVFIRQGSTFAVMAHEAPSDKLEDVMSLRDRLMDKAAQAI